MPLDIMCGVVRVQWNQCNNKWYDFLSSQKDMYVTQCWDNSQENNYLAILYLFLPIV